MFQGTLAPATFLKREKFFVFLGETIPTISFLWGIYMHVSILKALRLSTMKKIFKNCIYLIQCFLNPQMLSLFVYLLASPGNCPHTSPAIFTWFATEILKHSIPDYFVRGTDFFSLRLSVITVNESNVNLFFCQIGQNYIFWCAEEF